MSFTDRVLGWLRQSPSANDDELEQAEEDLTQREYQEEIDDVRADGRLGARPGEFESDQRGPR